MSRADGGTADDFVHDWFPVRDTAKHSFLQDFLEVEYMIGDEMLENYRFWGFFVILKLICCVILRYQQRRGAHSLCISSPVKQDFVLCCGTEQQLKTQKWDFQPFLNKCSTSQNKSQYQRIRNENTEQSNAKGNIQFWECQYIVTMKCFPLSNSWQFGSENPSCRILFLRRRMLPLTAAELHRTLA